jgi:hypothetical protein
MNMILNKEFLNYRYNGREFIIIFKVIKVIFLILFLLFFTQLLVFPMGGKIEPIPIKNKKVVIQNRELLKYSRYFGGENTEIIYFVAGVDETNRRFTEYIDQVKVSEIEKMPKHYTNYHFIMKVSLDEGYLEEAYFDYNDLEYNDENVPNFMDLKIDMKSNLATYIIKSGKKDQLKITYSKIHLKPDYPVWNIAAFIWIGPRCLDIKSKGMFYIVEPFFVKEPIPTALRIIGKEVIETKAGKFNTVKAGFTIADPFLGRLLNTFTQKLYFWIEDSPRGLIIKAQMDQIVSLLDEISVWKE